MAYLLLKSLSILLSLLFSLQIAVSCEVNPPSEGDPSYEVFRKVNVLLFL